MDGETDTGSGEGPLVTSEQAQTDQEETQAEGSTSAVPSASDPSGTIDGTPAPQSLLPDQTPQSTNAADITDTPAISLTPDPEQSPEPTATPQLGRTDTYAGSLGELSIQITSADPTADPAVGYETTLGIVGIDATNHEEAYTHYLALLDGLVAEDQLEHCMIYELQYAANGESIQPPQGEANLKLCNSQWFSTYAPKSFRVFYLLDAEGAFSEKTGLSIDEENGTIECAASHCPAVIIVYAAPAPEATATPEATEAPVYVFESADGLRVTGSPASADALPEGAQLYAERITAESNPEQYALYLSMLQTEYDTELPISFVAYDISFRVDGQEVEPYGDVVNVTISDEAYLQSMEAPQVYHVVGEESEAPALEEVAAKETTVAEGAEVSFATESFSTFIVLPGGSRLTNKSIAVEADTFTHTSYYNSSRPLGIAGNFHIVAFNTATLTAHTNGNLLVKSLSASGTNFGTKNLASELSYVQTYTTMASNSASSTAHVLVIGSGNTVTLTDGGNSFVVNGTKLDTPWNLWKDASTATLPFIDLNAVKAQMVAISNSLSTNNTNVYIDSSNLRTTGANYDNSYITLTNPDKVGFYNITAAQLSDYGFISVKGFQSGHNGTVIINVDCTGVTGTITPPESRMFVDGTLVSFSEVTNFTNGRILWNFINCNATINISKVFYASVLAPNATINVSQNLNGTIIGNNVSISAESHRDDFLGGLDNGVTVTANKVWSDYGTGAPANTSITLQLYYSTDGGTTRTAEGTAVTLNSTTGWTHSWTEMPTGRLYTVVETSIMQGSTNMTTAYKTTYSTVNGVSSGAITVTNSYLYRLPSTGGPGTNVFLVLGGLLCSAAGIFWLQHRRQRHSATAPPNNRP